MLLLQLYKLYPRWRSFLEHKNQINKKTDNLVLWELEKNQNTLTEVKNEHTLKFGITKPTKRYQKETKAYTNKLGTIRLIVYNSVFNITEMNNQFTQEAFSEW